MRIEREDLMMSFANLVSHRSTCKRLHVGTIIVTSDFKYIVGYGYNGNYAGGPNTCDDEEPGKCGCIHAEVNALIKCIEKDKECYLFTTISPCMACAKLILNAENIARVYYKEEYRDTSPIFLLMSHLEVYRYVQENNRFELARIGDYTSD